MDQFLLRLLGFFKKKTLSTQNGIGLFKIKHKVLVNVHTKHSQRYRRQSMNLQYERLLEDLEDLGYSKFGKLDSGSYSHVVRAQSPSGEKLAIKFFTGQEFESGISDHFIREVHAMTSLRHPGIVPLRLAFVRESAIAICTPLYDTNLFRYIGLMSDQHKPVAVNVVKHVMRSLVQAVKFAHDSGFAHRDLKPANIFIHSSTPNVVVGDWGLARHLSDVTPSELSPDVISTWYAPPEVLCTSKRYGTPVDVWSLGVILLDLVNGNHIFAGDERDTFVYKIIALLGTTSLSSDDKNFLTTLTHRNIFHLPKKNGHLDDVVKKWTASPDDIAKAIDLIRGMLAVLPCRRLTCDQILAHPFFEMDADLEPGSVDFEKFRFDISSLRPTVRPPPVPCSLTCHEVFATDGSLTSTDSTGTAFPALVVIIPKPRLSSFPKDLSTSELKDLSWKPACTAEHRLKVLAFLSRLPCFSPAAYTAAMQLSHSLSDEQCNFQHMFACYSISHVAVRPVYELLRLRENRTAGSVIPGLLESGIETVAELRSLEAAVLKATGGNVLPVPSWFENFSVLSKSQAILACALVSVPDIASGTCRVRHLEDLETFATYTLRSKLELTLFYNCLATHKVSFLYFPRLL